MLKIKDNVDLKELEKFGFEKVDSYDYYFWKIIVGGHAAVCILKKSDIFCDKRIFLNYYPASITEEQFNRAFKEYENTLFDIIQAGLVEKVED